jgi:hypothetical protein
VAPLALADGEAAFYPIAGYSARMSARIPAVTGALLIALLVPASAQAVTIAPLKPCYVTAGTAAAPQQEGVTIQAAGFTPNSTVTIAVDGQPIGQPGAPPQEFQTDPTGNLNLPPNSVPAPFVETGTREFPITLTEVGNEANTATVTSKSTALGVSVKPKRARPSKRIRFKGSGFTGEKPVYAHYVFKSKLRKTVRMARKTGTCGAWSARKRQIPVNEPKPGLWTVQFDQSKRFIADATKIPSVFVRLGISVTLVPQRG